MLREAKAKREGVEALTSEDIDGLSLEQIKKLRGILASREPSPGGAAHPNLIYFWR